MSIAAAITGAIIDANLYEVLGTAAGLDVLDEHDRRIPVTLQKRVSR